MKTITTDGYDPVHIDELSDKRQLAIDLMVIGTKHQDVADGVGISRQQLWRWRQERSFVVALERRRAELHQGLADQFWEAWSGKRSQSPPSRSLKATPRWRETSGSRRAP